MVKRITERARIGSVAGSSGRGMKCFAGLLFPVFAGILAVNGVLGTALPGKEAGVSRRAAE